MFKPELLLPAGNPEAFYAALEGGADAIYLGLQQFNARQRAGNFTLNQLPGLIREAGQRSVKIYLTLNTLIKNQELPELITLLNALTQINPAALIIQDAGVLYLVKKYFPQLKLHASTQMGHHNSLGAVLAEQLGFERVILARELTYEELALIKKNSSIPLEIFIHGALCYSFSGMCLFSSYMGGMSANRGNCCQPCRRKYCTADRESYFFNLKDNQQTAKIRKLQKMGIASLKVEGRMKSASYVYRVAKAYRQLIDDPRTLKDAEMLLQSDLGREKTAYFLSGEEASALAEIPYSGLLLGRVTASKPELKILLSAGLTAGDTLRIYNDTGFESAACKINSILLNGKSVPVAEAGMEVELPEFQGDYQTGDLLFLVRTTEENFPSSLKKTEYQKPAIYPSLKMKNILQQLANTGSSSREELFIRINDRSWLPLLEMNRLNHLILRLPLVELTGFDPAAALGKESLPRLIIQLPPFIPEKKIHFWKKEINRLLLAGVTSFMLSHLSQKLLFSGNRKVRLYSSEHVYALNDAAISLLQEQGIFNWIFPFENDFPNLIAGNDRRGIVPLYFFPELFISRMPTALNDNEEFSDRKGTYQKKESEGLTLILPKNPVALLHFHRRLFEKGFRRFLLDLSWQPADSGFFTRLIKLYADSQTESPATTFNFKMGLK